MTSRRSMTVLAGFGLAVFVGSLAAAPAAAQCYATSYYAAAPVYVAPAPVYVVPAPVVYQQPVRYVTTHVGYSGGYRQHHVYYQGHRRHYGRHGSSWGFGFHVGRH